MITLYYPALQQHLKVYKRKLAVAERISNEREKRKIENISKGFNPTACEMERAFLDLNRSVNIDLLREIKAVYCQ